MKSFLQWFQLKPKLSNNNSKPPLVKEREIWWASIGMNVGSEIDGKSHLLARPVVILKKLAHGFFFVAPTTSKPHTGSWYTEVSFSGSKSYVCLHQARAIDYRRLSTRIVQLDDADFLKVKKAFHDLYQ